MKKLLLALFILTASCLMLFTACATECETCSFGEWTVVADPTCTTEGEKVRVCSECQTEERESIPMKDHKLSLKETTLVATCTSDGKEVWGCSNCDYTEERTVKATGHRETKSVTAEATCNKEGKITYTCSACNNVRETITPKASHDYTSATCKKPATCKKCGATTGSTAKHSYSEATCTEAKKCTVCGVTDGKALGHTTTRGNCSRCHEFISPISNIKYANEFPLVVTCANGTKVQLISPTVSWGMWVSVEILFQIIEDHDGGSQCFRAVLKDSQGIVADSCLIYTSGEVGEKQITKKWSLDVPDSATPGEFTIYFESVSW